LKARSGPPTRLHRFHNVFKFDYHIFGDGDEQGQDGDFSLARMLNKHDGDAGFGIDGATRER
jgi:hypothetical protein